MPDHHEAYNNMMQINGLGLAHHLNGAPPQIDMNGSVNSQLVDNLHNGAVAQNNTSAGVLPVTIMYGPGVSHIRRYSKFKIPNLNKYSKRIRNSKKHFNLQQDC